MDNFTYTRAADAAAAIARVSADARADYLAGGTTMVDLMKLRVVLPQALVDVRSLPIGKIEATDAAIKLGAGSSNSAVAYHADVRKRLPALSEAILSGATPQIRNVATVAGNLLQRTRCYYFRDAHTDACNKRTPGSGCAAQDGFHRIHAVLGAGDKCFATNPSDMCVALAAYGATVNVQSAKGDRAIPFADFFVGYNDDPAKETTLQHGELITSVEIKTEPWFAKSTYLKVRDRESYEFALTSAAVALQVEGGAIKSARIALGGVATKPWRAIDAEAKLVGGKADKALFTEAANIALKDAKPRRDNAYKVELAKRTIIRALETVAAMA